MMKRQAMKAMAAVVLIATMSGLAAGAEFCVATAGRDGDAGTKDKPFATLQRAQQAVRAVCGKEPVTVWLRGGTYYLPATLVLGAEDSGTKAAPVVWRAFENETPVISGAVKLELKWEPYRDGILKAQTPAGLTTDQLFINGERQVLARYPNFDPRAQYFNGFAADCISPERAARWKDPRGGFIHAMHRNMWGGFHYVITGKDDKGALQYEGGWQNNRRLGMHGQYRFVENIFEELDAPGEWFLDARSSTLYFYPPPGVDLAKATVETVRLRHLVEFQGSQQKPVRFVTLKGLAFRHAARTFMDNKEPLLRSDWTTYRGGAVFFQGAEDCALEDCLVDQVGGNAVFVSNYNRRVTLRGCHILKAGGNGVAFVGDPGAVRNPLFECGQRQKLKDIDRTPGPKTDNYPADCLVDDCLIHETGGVEKQTAPVEIAMSQNITVRHCSIYNVPRAGINIGDGCWGGHIIEFCDIFDTVKETGDHGSFNSWGRDRYWLLKDVNMNDLVAGPARDTPLLDTVRPVILRNNRWRCDHGWDIDLDDGSTNYQIYNNLCLNGGIKNREGFFRVVENNVMVNNSFHPHVWFANSQDVFRRNIVFTGYRPIDVNKPWGKECDFNLLHKPGQAAPVPATGFQQQSGLDTHSLEADAMFVDPATGDYRVREGSPALALGFKNFAMDQFGVQRPALRAIARTPALPTEKPATAKPKRNPQPTDWLGAKVRNISGEEEMSAYGLGGEIGSLMYDVPPGSPAAKAGFLKGDIVLVLNGVKTYHVGALKEAYRAIPAGKTAKAEIIRGQSNVTITVEGGLEPAGESPPARK
jgi:hypothetical protein